MPRISSINGDDKTLSFSLLELAREADVDPEEYKIEFAAQRDDGESAYITLVPR